MNTAADHHDDGSVADYAAIAELFRDGHATFIALAERHRWAPATGSQAADDRIALVGVDPNSNERDNLAGFDLVVEVAITELNIAALHLEGLAALFDKPWLFLTPDVVIRSIVEALGHALWMLAPAEFEPDKQGQRRPKGVAPADAARGRLARAYLLHIASGVRDKELDAIRAGDTKPGAARLVEAKRRCRAVFPTSTAREVEGSPNRAPRLAGEELPGLVAMVKYFFNTTLDHEALVATAKEPNPVYGFLSTASHPTLLRVRELRSVSADPERSALELQLNSEVPMKLSAMTIGLFYVVLRAFVNYFGYPSDLTDQLADQINEVFPGTIL